MYWRYFATIYIGASVYSCGLLENGFIGVSLKLLLLRFHWCFQWFRVDSLSMTLKGFFCHFIPLLLSFEFYADAAMRIMMRLHCRSSNTAIIALSLSHHRYRIIVATLSLSYCRLCTIVAPLLSLCWFSDARVCYLCSTDVTMIENATEKKKRKK